MDLAWWFVRGVRTATTRCQSNPIHSGQRGSCGPESVRESLPSPPLVTALQNTAANCAISFHFPGHNRGLAAPPSLTSLIGHPPFSHDLPNDLSDFLGPTSAAQHRAAALFGASQTWFLVGGTTLGIQAAIMATCAPGDVLILPRNSHLSAFSAMLLAGALPKYLLPRYHPHWDIPSGLTPSQVEMAILESEAEHARKPAAVLVTSPTYHGICSDLAAIARICHSHGIPLIVDEAHGAHLGFHPRMPRSALQQGADLAAQSTHKVLSSLTQSSMLHMSGNLVDSHRICASLQALQTTSPSNLLLASLDAATHQISHDPEAIFEKPLQLAVEAKDKIAGLAGISVLDSLTFSEFPFVDPLRLTVGFSQLGLSSGEADEILYEDHGIVCELVGTRSITLAFNLGTCNKHVERLVSGLEHVVALAAKSSKIGLEKKPCHGICTPFADYTTALIPREAFFARKRRVSIEECLGEVCGELICPYPPGIPVMIPGETITEKALEYLLDVRDKGAIINGASDPKLLTLLVCS